MNHEAICVIDHEDQLGKAILGQLANAKAIDRHVLYAYIQKQCSPEEVGQKIMQLYRSL